MFSVKFNRYLNDSGCSAKDFSAMTGISEATVSRYRMGKTVPAVNSGKIELISETFAKLLNDQQSAQEVYEDLLVAAYEDLEAVDYKIYAGKLAELIDGLGIVQTKLADEIHISSSYISRICSGQVKPRNPVYIAEMVARYVSYNYTSEENKKIVRYIIGEEATAAILASPNEYFRCVRRWLLRGENYKSRIVENLFYKYNDYSKNDYFEYRDEEIDYKTTYTGTGKELQTYSGGDSFKEGFMNWIACACSSKLNDDIYIFDEILSTYARSNPDFACEYFSAMEKLVRAGKKCTVIHNVENDMHVAATKSLCWIPINVSGRLTHVYINEPRGDLYRNTLMSASNCAFIGSIIGDDYEHGHFVLTRSASEVLLARARIQRLREKTEISYKYCENRKEFEAEMLKLFEMVKPEDELKVYLPLPSFYSMSEDFFLQMLRNNGVRESAIPEIMSRFKKEQKAIYELCDTNKITVYMNYIGTDAWEGADVTFDVYGEKLTYTRADYEENIKMTYRLAEKKPNIRLLVEKMDFYKNLFLLIVPNKFFIETTYYKSEKYLIGTDSVTVGSLDILMTVVARDDPEDTPENKALYRFIQSIVKKR